MNHNHRWSNCEKCGIKRRTRSLKKRKGVWYCYKCYKCEIIEIPYHKGKVPDYILPKKRIVKDTLPVIDSIQPNKRISTKGLYLSKNEKLFLFKKYQKKLGSTSASLKVKNVCFMMNKLIYKLKEEKKSKKEMQRIFIEELEKHIQESTI